MKLPDYIKIGAYSVKVRYVPNLMTDDGECGNYNPRTQEISIDPDLSPDMQYGILYHEMIEAIKSIYSIECLEKDHQAINQLGEALHQVLRDNREDVLPR